MILRNVQSTFCSNSGQIGTRPKQEMHGILGISEMREAYLLLMSKSKLVFEDLDFQRMYCTLNVYSKVAYSYSIYFTIDTHKNYKT